MQALDLPDTIAELEDTERHLQEALDTATGQAGQALADDLKRCRRKLAEKRGEDLRARRKQAA